MKAATFTMMMRKADFDNTTPADNFMLQSFVVELIIFDK